MTINYSFRWRQQIVEDEFISSTTKLVAHTLHFHMDNKTGECFPSEELIAKESGLSVRSVVSHIKKLKQKFYIAIHKKKSGQGWNRNVYKALLRPAYAALPLDEKSASDAKGYANRGHKTVQEVHINSLYNSSINSIEDNNCSIEIDTFFNQFWEIYPKEKRYSETKCRDLWRKNKLENIGQKIIDGLKSARLSEQWNKGYVPSAYKFIDEEQWQRTYKKHFLFSATTL